MREVGKRGSFFGVKMIGIISESVLRVPIYIVLRDAPGTPLPP